MRVFFLASAASVLLAACGLVLDTSPPDSNDGGVVPTPECDAPEDCDDGLFCNGFESCVAGTCQTIGRPRCEDGVACTNDTCVEATDTCRHVPMVNACGSQVCHPTNGCITPEFCIDDEDCDDDDACTSESCDPGMFCVYGDKKECPSSGCLRGVCDPDTAECGTEEDDAACQDDVTCTTGECKSDGECRQSTDDGVCDDGFGCTEDVCLGVGVNDSTGCAHKPDDEVCRTSRDLCYEEVCAPHASGSADMRGCAVRVPPGACRAGRYCDFASGDCQPLRAASSGCDDGDPCNGVETLSADMTSCVTTGGCPEPSNPCLESVCEDDGAHACGVRVNPDTFHECLGSF